MQWGGDSLVPPACRLKKSLSAHELGKVTGMSDGSEEEEEEEEEEEDDDDENRSEKGLLVSPRERIKNMWQDFTVEKGPGVRQARRRHRRPRHHDSFSSLQSQPADGRDLDRKVRGRRGVRKKASEENGGDSRGGGGEGGGGGGGGCGRPRVTIPQPFAMTLREADRKLRAVKTRTEMERENADLRRQLEELTECRQQFRASPMPTHVRLPLYDELRRREEERRQRVDNSKPDETSLPKPAASSPRPFSFLERERLKREQREEELRRLAQEEALVRREAGFRAKPVPRSVRDAAAASERLKEEQLYRAVKAQMRARELLHSAAMPPSMLARRLEERRQKEEKDRARQEGERDRASHRPKINCDVPDFDASYRRFRKQLERGRREAKTLTSCEPFRLRTASLPSLRRQRATAPADASPRDYRWPFLASANSSPCQQRGGPPRTSLSSLGSSLSGSQEVLSAKITDAARKRQEAIR